MRVEVPAGDDAHDRGAEPEPNQPRRAPPAEDGERGERRQRLPRGRKRRSEQVPAMDRGAGEDRVGVAAVGDHGVPPLADPRRARGAVRDRRGRAGQEERDRSPRAAPLLQDEERDRRQARVEGRLPDHQRAPGQEARDEEPPSAPAAPVRAEGDERQERRHRAQELARERERLDERRGACGCN